MHTDQRHPLGVTDTPEPRSARQTIAVEGAKFWAGVCAELRNRGIRDVLIVCCDCEDDQAPSRAAA